MDGKQHQDKQPKKKSGTDDLREASLFSDPKEQQKRADFDAQVGKKVEKKQGEVDLKKSSGE